jgi:hypothetical protein
MTFSAFKKNNDYIRLYQINPNQMYVMPFEKEYYVELPKLYVLCHVTDTSESFFKKLTESSVKYGLVLQPFSTDPYDFMVHFIQDKLATDIILFINGHKTLINGDKTQLITQYKWFQQYYGDKAIFSAEKKCCIKGYTPEQFPKTPFDYRYLHSDTFISSISALRTILAYKQFNTNFLTQLYLKELVLLDTHALIFNVVHQDLNDLERHAKKWYNTQTHSYPLILIADDSTPFLLE